ncbi:hypothetical protein AG1IA_08665 [Rhizoctonia solani AG-1 IA]|uniref:Uncharacterized protein n=1 Tax=Thanatephorus cucumeris (strain AG1-IA) TaxID=983506 RepID=L8WHB8_THACA|nr:hypothetical protein AG1IA_08665 [Rhizoctonia solani AG-1 IA]
MLDVGRSHEVYCHCRDWSLELFRTVETWALMWHKRRSSKTARPVILGFDWPAHETPRTALTKAVQPLDLDIDMALEVQGLSADLKISWLTTMSALMDVDSTHEDPQTGSLSNAHQAKLQLNTRVMNAIQKRKANNPNSLFVSSRCFTANDAPTLLCILLEIHSGKDEVPMTIPQYHQYLMDNVELLEDLLSAYTSKNYEELMDHRKWGSQFYSECYALVDVTFVISSSDAIQSISKTGRLKSAFEDHYVGNTAKLFIDTLNRERHLPTGQAAANRPYNWSISVVQSSGMGKSRMVEEAANTVFTIPINIREKLPEGRITYPPPDKNIREFFLKRQSLSDKQQQADYMLFFKLLFDKTHEVVQDCFLGITGSDLALAWAKYFNKGQNIVEVGTKQKLFYDSVIKDANLVSSVSVGISSIGRNSRYQDLHAEKLSNTSGANPTWLFKSR